MLFVAAPIAEASGQNGEVFMAVPHASPGKIVDLRPLGSSLKDTNTTAIVKTDQFEAIRLIVHAGSEIPSHKVASNILLHCLEGHVELGLARSIVQLKAGDWVYLDRGELHSVKGIEDASLLLTILFDR